LNSDLHQAEKSVVGVELSLYATLLIGGAPLVLALVRQLFFS
jgi:hypothetical protein